MGFQLGSDTGGGNPTEVLQRRYFVHRFLGTRRWEPPTREDWHQQSIPCLPCIDCGLNTPWGLCSQCLPSLYVTGSILWRWFDALAADGKLCQRMVFCMGSTTLVNDAPDSFFLCELLARK